MNLGAFSVSLAVKDIEKSKAFYERLGFQVFHGEAAQHWLDLSVFHAETTTFVIINTSGLCKMSVSLP